MACITATGGRSMSPQYMTPTLCRTIAHVQLHHELSSSLDALTGQGVRQSVGGDI